MSSCPTDSANKEDSEWEPESLRRWSTTPRRSRRSAQQATKRRSVQSASPPQSSPRPKRRDLKETLNVPPPNPGSHRATSTIIDIPVERAVNVSGSGSAVAMEFCPGCQMPFVARTADWCHRHVADCLDFPARSKQACPHGDGCTFSSPFHFRQFSHHALAVKRSKVPTADDHSTDVTANSAFVHAVDESGILDDHERSKVDTVGQMRKTAVASTTDNAMSQLKKNAHIHQGDGQLDNQRTPGKLAMFSLASTTQRANASSSKDLVYTPSNDLAQLSLQSASFSEPLEEHSPSSVTFEDDVEEAKLQSLDDSSQLDALHKEEEDADCSIERVVKSHTLALNTKNSVTDARRLEQSVFPAPAAGPLRQSAISSFFSLDGSQSKGKSPKGGAGLGLKRIQSSGAGGCKPAEWPKGMLRTASEPPASRQQGGHGRGRVGRHDNNSTGGGGGGGGGASSISDGGKESRVDGNSTDGAAISSAKGKRGRRECPSYKRIPDTGFTVDAFSYGVIDGCKAYFLSHFHSDHYQGLNKSFSQSMYCSKSTANLVVSQLRVSVQNVHSLPMGEPVLVHNILVTLIDANHCPGSVMFLFHLPDGRLFLHTGDCRASDELISSPELRGLLLDALYLDTTYLNPQYTFPPQQDCVQFAIEKAKEAVMYNARTLIVCGTYSVGKERVFVAVAKALGSRIAVSTAKKKILSCLEWSELTALLTTDWSAAQVHVLPMMQVNQKGLADHLARQGNTYSAVIGFRPTGWTQQKGQMSLGEIRPSVRGPVTVYGIPYSEHSSYSELKEFVQHFRPARVIPTVGSFDERQLMQRTFNQWLAKV